jgi:hypothetical protein
MIGRVLRGVDGLRTWFTEIDEQFDSWQLQIDPPSAAPRRGTSPRPGEEASRYS